ncbi:MAG: NAD(+) synthase [Pseudomonadaceae bacterium]|nr:NAD(+) synthase [Pseudomonadaceae bacterium]
MNANDFGLLRVAAIAPEVHLADPAANAVLAKDAIARLGDKGVSLVLFPELSLTGYSAEDLFFSSDLHRAVKSAILEIASHCRGTAAVIGVPWDCGDGRMLNCALVLADGRVLGGVPKQHHPNYGEFYEKRWFVPGSIDVSDAELGDFRIAPEQLFEIAGARFGIEICEDLWAPQAPGAVAALAGADIVLNLSASNELVAKASYRRDLVRMNSAQSECGYLYASSGPTESSKDVVFGGHLIACENGQFLAESERFALTGSELTVEFDIEHIRHDRRHNQTFAAAARPAPYAKLRSTQSARAFATPSRSYPKTPFVPSDAADRDEVASEILAIQATGLARRLMATPCTGFVVGLSGGLDSTQALLVCLDAIKRLPDRSVELHAVTLPGPGTSDYTLESARTLATEAGCELHEIDIGPAVTQHLSDLGHDADNHNVVFENAQARERTQILFNLANQRNALVVGTGDLSELALGWCTFNADQMANYNVNASVPKTLVRYLVRWFADSRATPGLAQVLHRIVDTPVSPELIPKSDVDDNVGQHTEAIIGPYELHDFFLYHFVRNGFGVEKILFLARHTFADAYSKDQIATTLRIFISRFFSQQFKRTTLPPGPKVGSVSLSPRGDWRMPDEASASRLLALIDNFED